MSRLVDEEDIEPYSIEEVQRLLLEASKLRNSARWVVALALGLRQGEALGARMRARYMHITGPMLRKVARQVGDALWELPAGGEGAD